MDISVIVNQVVILFLIIIVGLYARKRNVITADTTGKLSTLLLQITMPMLIFSSFDFEVSEEMLRNALLVLVLSFLIHFFSMLIAKFLYVSYQASTRNILKFVTVFSNCAFMGFPVLYSVFGSKGVFYGALYGIPFNILALSYGVMIFTGKNDKDTLKKIIIHPVNLSVVAGMVFFLLKIQLPKPVSEAVAMTGSMTSPLSMVIVGALLADVPIRGLLRGSEIYIGSAVRLIVIPLIVYGLLSLLPIPREVMQVCIILAAMPAAANATIFAEKFGGDAMLAARLTSISTIFSILTIPLILMLL